MKVTPKSLLAACNDLSLSELLQLQEWMVQLIEERQQELIRRKGDRVIDDLRGLMARAGVSFDEFQSAISGDDESG